MNPTKKAFRKYLNAKYPLTSGGRGKVSGRGPTYGATKRPYGDYLYTQDREKFDAEYAEWAWEQHHSVDGRLTACRKSP